MLFGGNLRRITEHGKQRKETGVSLSFLRIKHNYDMDTVHNENTFYSNKKHRRQRK